MTPWTGETFKRHWKKGSKAQRAKAAAIASAIIEDPGFDGDEGKAIATGIARAKGLRSKGRGGR